MPQPLFLPLGPIMLDVPGTELGPEDREILCHPGVGGVILFSRNFATREQLTALVADIHGLRDPPLLVAVDHEGGRVQRFRQAFVGIPAMRRLGARYDEAPEAALADAFDTGLVIAADLRACGVDLTFAPVLDLDYGASTVIGDRALHSRPDAVVPLATALIRGLAAGGMPSVGKHFPGHGFVGADSHLAVPEDGRSLEEIFSADLLPYRHHRELGLNGVMPAHVIYTAVDPHPAGFSSFWLSGVLRARLGFDGLIFSDDLKMEGARVAGSVADALAAALAAGCDMGLICNDRSAAEEALSARTYAPVNLDRLSRFLAPARGAACATPAVVAQATERLRAWA